MPVVGQEIPVLPDSQEIRALLELLASLALTALM
jgi:hypothetical protein